MPQEGGIFNMRSLLIIAAVGVAAYFLFFRKSSSSTSPSTSGGGGTITTGDTTVTSGSTPNVEVNVTQSPSTSSSDSSGGGGGDSDGGGTGGSNPQPTPPTQTKIPGHHTLQSTGHQTLAQIAKQYGTTPKDIISFTEAHKTHISKTESNFFKKGTGVVPKGIVLWIPEPQVPPTPSSGAGVGASGTPVTSNPGGINVSA
jgi:hypothetical protein